MSTECGLHAPTIGLLAAEVDYLPRHCCDYLAGEMVQPGGNDMKNAGLLRNALMTNALFSGLTGAGALMLAGPLSESLGPPPWSLRAIGAGLLLFAATVAREARAPGRARAWQIISADIGWVIAAAAIVALAPSWLSAAGRIALVGVTVVVAGMAAAQWRGLETSP